MVNPKERRKDNLMIEPVNEFSATSEMYATCTRIAWPESKSRLHICPGFQIDLDKPPPNPWWRLWQWVFFGWRWEAL